jgi:hypothetical protein
MGQKGGEMNGEGGAVDVEEVELLDVLWTLGCGAVID